MNKNVHLRWLATTIIQKVIAGHSLSALLPTACHALSDPRDRALVQAFCYGVCRFYTRLETILAELLKTPLKSEDQDIHVLLLLGLYQLSEMRIPAYAAVTETVDTVQAFHKKWAKGLVNGVLRTYLRSSHAIAKKIVAHETAHYAHPAWWIHHIKQAWPDDWQAILQANNAHPLFALRVNAKQQTRAQYQAALTAKGWVATEIPETCTGLVLETAMPVEALPRFLEGAVSVQDGASQLVVPLLDAKPGQRILDACAAPGGKLLHLLETTSDLAAVIAVEKDPVRMKLIEENLAREQLSAHCECICADIENQETWWDGKKFDRILLDAPCSASGVIRRHPDIKLLRKVGDLPALVAQQRKLLECLWPLLADDGLLLYTTCSIFPEENTELLEAFLAAHQDARIEQIQVGWGIAQAIGRQILPGNHGMDGFYYGRLRK